MCKVLIKEVKKAHEPKTGTSSSGTKWSLWLFDCVVDVDDTGKTAERVVKTFDEKTADKIKAGAGKTFEAKKQGEASPFSYLVEPERKAGGGRQFGKSNRQVALECASRVVAGSGYVSDMGDQTPMDFTLLEAEKALAWLEGGAK